MSPIYFINIKQFVREKINCTKRVKKFKKKDIVRNNKNNFIKYKMQHSHWLLGDRCKKNTVLDTGLIWTGCTIDKMVFEMRTLVRTIGA